MNIQQLKNITDFINVEFEKRNISEAVIANAYIDIKDYNHALVTLNKGDDDEQHHHLYIANDGVIKFLSDPDIFVIRDRHNKFIEFAFSKDQIKKEFNIIELKNQGCKLYRFTLNAIGSKFVVLNRYRIEISSNSSCYRKIEVFDIFSSPREAFEAYDLLVSQISNNMPKISRYMEYLEDWDDLS